MQRIVQKFVLQYSCQHWDQASNISHFINKTILRPLIIILKDILIAKLIATHNEYSMNG